MLSPTKKLKSSNLNEKNQQKQYQPLSPCLFFKQFKLFNHPNACRSHRNTCNISCPSRVQCSWKKPRNYLHMSPRTAKKRTTCCCGDISYCINIEDTCRGLLGDITTLLLMYELCTGCSLYGIIWLWKWILLILLLVKLQFSLSLKWLIFNALRWASNPYFTWRITYEKTVWKVCVAFVNISTKLTRQKISFEIFFSD